VRGSIHWQAPSSFSFLCVSAVKVFLQWTRLPLDRLHGYNLGKMGTKLRSDRLHYRLQNGYRSGYKISDADIHNGTKIFGNKYGNAAYVIPPAALDSPIQIPNLVPHHGMYGFSHSAMDRSVSSPLAKNQFSEISAVASPTPIATISSSMPFGEHLEGQESHEDDCWSAAAPCRFRLINTRPNGDL
jgi:hypothetical protein